ncbi:MAG: hypothetical protein HF967_06350 [Methanosarcinales archaeon]|nr:hypothetical protein [Methanosarcinales archaeon]
MATITISKKLIKNDDLIIIPRKEYEKILYAAKKQKYTQLDKDLDKAIAEYKAGKVFGPFNSAEDGIKFLKKRASKIKK